MSRTYNHRGKKWRNIKNALYKKNLGMWNEDFRHKKKNRELSRRLRARLKRKVNKEVKEECG